MTSHDRPPHPRPALRLETHLERADEKGIYKCPVYKTEQRGPTFVFRAMLKSKSPPARWLFAAVAIVLDLVL